MEGYDARRYADEMPDKLLLRLARPEPSELSPAELQAVRWASVGLNNLDIARVTGRSPYTAQSQMRNAMRKLAAKNRTHAVALALRKGLID